jgi:hypothetical protein
LGWGRRRRNKGGEGRQSDHKLTFADRIRPSMILSAILTINRPRHCTEIPVWIPWWFCQQFEQWIGHITIWSCRFESLGDSVGKITRENFHVSEPSFFFNSKYFVCHSVGKYWPKKSACIYQRNYRRKKLCW